MNGAAIGASRGASCVPADFEQRQADQRTEARRYYEQQGVTLIDLALHYAWWHENARRGEEEEEE